MSPSRSRRSRSRSCQSSAADDNCSARDALPAAERSTPHTYTYGEFYATNNHFQFKGPKGFLWTKVLGNDDMFMRVDVPGMETARVWLDDHKQNLFYEGDGSKASDHEDSGRTYSSMIKLLRCNCCSVIGFGSQLKDGVLRVIIHKVHNPSKSKSKDPRPCSGIESGGHVLIEGHGGPVVEENPFLSKGPKGAFEMKAMKEGTYVRVDMPGVPEGNLVCVARADSEVQFFGEAPKLSEHEDGGRGYCGSVRLSTTTKIRMIKHELRNGVLRIWIFN